MAYGMAELADALERIQRLEYEGASLQVLEDACREAQTAMASLPDAPGAFHFLMHFLIDHDIRRRDGEYARMQYEQLARVLKELRRAPSPGWNRDAF